MLSEEKPILDKSDYNYFVLVKDPVAMSPFQPTEILLSYFFKFDKNILFGYTYNKKLIPKKEEPDVGC
jgi:hypothetical protein